MRKGEEVAVTLGRGFSILFTQLSTNRTYFFGGRALCGHQLLHIIDDGLKCCWSWRLSPVELALLTKPLGIHLLDHGF